MRELRLKAVAKINLGLDVLRRREDGYHDLRMVMQSVCLYDQVTLSVTSGSGISMSTNLNYLPVNRDNLAYQAAKLLMKEFSVWQGLHIDLRKSIPVAAGLAGGSSDAAAVLVGVNRLFRLGLSQQELIARAVHIGADVPYCVMRGTALAEGIGERLTRLPDAPDMYVVLAKPPVRVSTGYVYGNLRLDELESHPDIDAQIEAIRAGDALRMTQLMGNVLETVTIPACPVIAEIKERMLCAGAAGAMMSGSGPTVFGLFEDRERASRAYEELSQGDLAKDVYLTRFFHTGRGRAEKSSAQA